MGTTKAVLPPGHDRQGTFRVVTNELAVRAAEAADWAALRLAALACDPTESTAAERTAKLVLPPGHVGQGRNTVAIDEPVDRAFVATDAAALTLLTAACCSIEDREALRTTKLVLPSGHVGQGNCTVVIDGPADRALEAKDAAALRLLAAACCSIEGKTALGTTKLVPPSGHVGQGRKTVVRDEAGDKATEAADCPALNPLAPACDSMEDAALAGTMTLVLPPEQKGHEMIIVVVIVAVPTLVELDISVVLVYGAFS